MRSEIDFFQKIYMFILSKQKLEPYKVKMQYFFQSFAQLLIFLRRKKELFFSQKITLEVVQKLGKIQ